MPQHIHPLPVAPHPFYRQHRPCPVNGFLPTHTPTTHAHTHTHTHSPSRLTGATWTIFKCAYGIGEGGMPFPGARRGSAAAAAAARGRAGAQRRGAQQQQRIRRGKGTSEKKKAIEPADAKIVARATCVSIIADFPSFFLLLAERDRWRGSSFCRALLPFLLLSLAASLLEYFSAPLCSWDGRGSGGPGPERQTGYGECSAKHGWRWVGK